MAILPRFYVYILSRPDGRPFYVGKGQGNRIDAHESFARNGYKARRHSIIRKIWREGGQVAKQKVFETDDEAEAYEMEQRIIAAIGREYLANETDGGDGNYGYRPTEEVRARIAKTLTGRKLTEQWKANVQAAKIGKPRSEACKAKIREKLTGMRRSPEAIKKGADAICGRPWSEKARQNITPSLSCPHPGLRGEKHHSAKLTAEQVREVRQLYKGGMKPKAIAELTGIKHGTVKGLLYSSRDWKWLNDNDGNIPT